MSLQLVATPQQHAPRGFGILPPGQRVVLRADVDRGCFAFRALGIVDGYTVAWCGSACFGTAIWLRLTEAPGFAFRRPLFVAVEE